MSKTDGAKTPAHHARAEDLVNDAGEADLQERKPIETLEDLGKAFVKKLDKDTKATGRFKPGANDEFWSVQPIGLPNGWHHDIATKWNFSVFEGRLQQACSDAEMAKGVR